MKIIFSCSPAVQLWCQMLASDSPKHFLMDRCVICVVMHCLVPMLCTYMLKPTQGHTNINFTFIMPSFLVWMGLCRSIDIYPMDNALMVWCYKFIIVKYVYLSILLALWFRSDALKYPRQDLNDNSCWWLLGFGIFIPNNIVLSFNVVSLLLTSGNTVKSLKRKQTGWEKHPHDAHMRCIQWHPVDV